MKLVPRARVELGPGALAFPHPPTVCLRADGSLLGIAEQRTDVGWVTSLVHVRPSGEHRAMPLPERAFGAQPVIVDDGDAGVIVLTDERTAVRFDPELESPTTVEVVDRAGVSGGERRVTIGGIVRSAGAGNWLVVLSDPTAFQNARTIARLRLDGTGATWEAAELLHGDDYPMAGGRTSTAPGGTKAPIVGDVLEVDGTRFAAVKGSDTMSLLKYGSDFFTLAELDTGGRVARRVYEERGWKKQPGKHGIRARFTSDGEYAILSPVFGTGEWKGRQQLLRLRDGSLEPVPSIRGTAGFALVDLRGEAALLASNDEVLLAERTE
ncbi:hypothetical protein M3147_17095 [Agromyces mediolanus]|uniref:hypothetical protein n=1 Tax=Agromyces mediolanus TaxID=41986 RepID=UPI00203E72CC|nr:hypothetical protein [Agromyces mediolanus]MCM3658976.1 hypothetical protein [Agromyces mediolanus]